MGLKGGERRGTKKNFFFFFLLTAKKTRYNLRPSDFHIMIKRNYFYHNHFLSVTIYNFLQVEYSFARHTVCTLHTFLHHSLLE